MIAKAPLSGAAVFAQAVAKRAGESDLVLPAGWREADWEGLFSYAHHVRLARGEILIRKEAAEQRALYFVVSGLLEVTAVLGAHSLGPIAKIHPGSVVGELAFLDGMPRSANVWAATDSELYRLDLADYERLATAQPRQACDLLFAVGRVVALRLRRAQSKPAGSS